MKMTQAQRMLAVLAAASLAGSGAAAMAQDSLAANNAPAATPGAPAPPLAYGVPQILQLAQAKVGDDTIIAYIRNSGNSYRLNADQIIYLRQQGLSDTVVTAMLNQPRAGVALTLPSTPAPPPVASTAYAGPASTAATYPYPQTVPNDCYYSEPCYDYYNPGYCYPGYVCYPPVPIGLGWGWGGGWCGGRYYGGYRGGWHGGFGGGWHGGGFAGARHVSGFGGGGHIGGFARVGHAGGFGGGGHIVGHR